MVRAQVRCYLAHTFGLRYYVRDVLMTKVQSLGILTKNPFYESDGTSKRKEVILADEYNLFSETSLNKKEIKKWSKLVKKKNVNIVKTDLKSIDRSDFTIAYMQKLSAGTMCEIFYTGVIKKRPVFLLTEDEELKNHPWIIYSCRFGKICSSLDELLKVLKRRYCS